MKEIAGLTVTPSGREMVERLRPGCDILGIEEAFREYSEAWNVLRASGKLPLAGVADVRDILGRIDPAGAFLFPEELLLIRANLEAVAGLKSLLTPSFKKEYPRISSRMDGLSGLSPLGPTIRAVKTLTPAWSGTLGTPKTVVGPTLTRATSAGFSPRRPPEITTS